MTEQTTHTDTDNSDLVWGAREIGKALNIPERKAFYLLEKEYIPAGKIGESWVVSRKKLEEFIESTLAGEEVK